MDDLEKKFQKRPYCYSVDELFRAFKKNKSTYFELIESLYQLEKKGIIYYDEIHQIYMRVSLAFYLDFGVLKISKRNQYYLDLTLGNRIMIPKEFLHQAKVGDCVFVQKESAKDKDHKKRITGKVVRVVAPISSDYSQNNFYQAKIDKDHARNLCYFLKDNEKIFIPQNSLSSAFPGDFVSLQILEERQGKKVMRKVKVVSILKRKKEEHLFTYRNGRWTSLETSFFPVRLLSGDTSFQEGDTVLAKVSLVPIDGVYELELVRKLDTKPLLSSKIEMLALKNGFSNLQTKEEIEGLSSISYLLHPSSYAKRQDFLNHVTLTIDPVNAKDLDDAISIEKFENFYRLYVHIADVSHYVKPGDALFSSAIQRGNSAYLPNFVFPMFDKKLSNHVCSLNEKQEKLAKTVVIDIDFLGNILDSSVFLSVIRNDYQLSYDKVDSLFISNPTSEEEYVLQPILRIMDELSSILERRRMTRGFSPLYVKSIEFELNEEGQPTRIIQPTKSRAHLMIENFMLIANEALTDYCFWLNLPLVYRNHEPPSYDRLRNLSYELKKYSARIKRLYHLEQPKILQKVLLSIMANKNEEEKNYISEIFLSSMKRAYYGAENKGHYGLALDKYATFTSPIRKGSDLINHTFLEEMLLYGDISKSQEKLQKDLPRICEHLSERQFAADELEREVNYLLLNEYANHYFSQEMQASVVFLTDGEMVLQTETGIFGFVSLDCTYFYDRCLGTVTDTVRHLTYFVGDTVMARLVSTDDKRKKMKFALCPSIHQNHNQSKIYQKKKGEN